RPLGRGDRRVARGAGRGKRYDRPCPIVRGAHRAAGAAPSRPLNVPIMKPTDPTIANLATAKSLLLDPWGLSETDMARAIGEIFTHRVDYADLYFQYTRSESWSLEEGMVKTGSFSIGQGVGVRAVSGEKTAFAYSDTLSPQALLSAARTVRGIARQGAGRARVDGGDQGPGRSLYADVDPLGTLTAQEKVALLERVERMARARDPRIIQVMAGLGAEYDVVLVA